MIHKKMTAISMALALALCGVVGLNATPGLGANPFSMQGGQACVGMTCVGSDLHVTTYQTQPDPSQAPPSAYYTGTTTSYKGGN